MWCLLFAWVYRLLMVGLPEGIAHFRRDLSVELCMFGDRITAKRYRRRLMEVRCAQRLFVSFPLFWFVARRGRRRDVACGAVALWWQVVISQTSPLVGVPLGSPEFRDHFSATVVAVRPDVLFHAKPTVDTGGVKASTGGSPAVALPDLGEAAAAAALAMESERQPEIELDIDGVASVEDENGAPLSPPAMPADTPTKPDDDPLGHINYNSHGACGVCACVRVCGCLSCCWNCCWWLRDGRSVRFGRVCGLEELVFGKVAGQCERAAERWEWWVADASS